MGVAPKPHGGPTAPEDRAWKWSGTQKLNHIIEHGGWDEVAEAHAWHDNGNRPPEKKTAYKLPHHELIDGRLQVVLAGVERSMNVVLGGRGGTKIPEADRRAAYEHLARHYEQFGREAPEYH